MFAKRMQNLQASGIRKMFELAATMKNPVNLSLGQADFDAPQPIKDAAIEAIASGKNRYSITAGIPELQQEIKRSLSAEGINIESSIAVAGASGGLCLALFALADEDCEVLIQDPYFVSYPALIKLTGATPKLIDSYPDFKLTPEKLRAAVTPRSRVLIFNSPSNPTGVNYTREEIIPLVKTAKELGLVVISDEVYDVFSYNGPFESWAKYDPDAVLIRSLSKTGGIPGWRAGFAAGPTEIIEQMKILQQFTFVCVNTPAQWASIVSLQHPELLESHINTYRDKRDTMCEGLSGRYKFIKPEGAFYLFPEIPGGDEQRFVQECIKRELLIVPGSIFSQRNSHFRISYAADDETLRRGILLLRDIADLLG